LKIYYVATGNRAEKDTVLVRFVDSAAVVNAVIGRIGPRLHSFGMSRAKPNRSLMTRNKKVNEKNKARSQSYDCELHT
jgi:hypothetical protein